MKIAYVGYDAFAYCLDALVSAGCEVAAVFSFPTDGAYETNTRLRAFAAEKGISFTTDRVTQDDLRRLSENGVRLLFSAGYIYKLPVTDRMYMVNYHPAPLPLGRGAWPFPVAILKDLRRYGVTLHKIAPAWDAGDILARAELPLTGRENLEDLMQACELAARPLVARLPASIDAWWQAAAPQVGGEYWQEPTDAARTITYTATPEEADRIARAFYGYGVLVQSENGEVFPVTRPRYVASLRKIDISQLVPLREGYILAE